MSFEAIKGISDAEVLAKVKLSEAEAQARQMLADAEATGKASLEAAKSRADSELRVLREKAEKQTSEKVAALEHESQLEAEQLRSAAEGKLGDAAALVVERIVGS